MELRVTGPEPRPCVVRQEGRALFHGFFVRAWTHGAAATIGGFSAGQESHPMAIVEFEDGRVDAVAIDAWRVRDSKGMFGEDSCENGGE